ncbi:hypothetical protein E4T56_gene3449 [Termitomyces sp. T112]|nr:hypothetical protein E4T56_gene3449 [Termitomyces sp. T112]
MAFFQSFDNPPRHGIHCPTASLTSTLSHADVNVSLSTRQALAHRGRQVLYGTSIGSEEKQVRKAGSKFGIRRKQISGVWRIRAKLNKLWLVLLVASLQFSRHLKNVDQSLQGNMRDRHCSSLLEDPTKPRSCATIDQIRDVVMDAMTAMIELRESWWHLWIVRWGICLPPCVRT